MYTALLVWITLNEMLTMLQDNLGDENFAHAPPQQSQEQIFVIFWNN